MAALEELQPDRRAVLQLLIARGRGYDQIAELLQMPEIVVRRRAHDALLTLAGPVPGLTDEDRALVSDYIVGELPATRRQQARQRLAESPQARRFARAAAARLSQIEGASLPDLPPEDAEVADALDALDARRERQRELEHESRRGGWFIVGGIAALVIAVVVALSLIAGGDDGNPRAVDPAPDERPAATTNPETFVAEMKSPSGDAEGQAALKPNDDGAIVIALNATGLAPSLRLDAGRIAVYGVWLAGPNTDPLFIGFPPSVGEDGDLSLQGLLNGVDNSPAVSSADLDNYTELLVTREVLESETARPTKPGRTALKGTLSTLR